MAFCSTSMAGSVALVQKRSAISVPKAPNPAVSPVFRGHLCYSRTQTRQCRVQVAEVFGLGAKPNTEAEHFLDVNALLKDFNPLTGSHLLAWGDSDDDDDTVQAEVPPAGTWEDRASGYQGLEHQPSWIDYRDGSESDDGDATRRRSDNGSPEDLAALFPHIGAAMGPDGAPKGAGALPATSVPSAYSPEAGFQEIPPHELEERLATGQFSLLLDVRSRAEYDNGYIAGALNLPLDTELSEAVRSGTLDEYRTRPVAVVCASGMRSSQATVRLTKVYGFANVTNVAGGMAAWAREGLPVQVRQQRPVGAGGGCGCGGGGGQGGGGGGCRNKQAV